MVTVNYIYHYFDFSKTSAATRQKDGEMCVKSVVLLYFQSKYRNLKSTDPVHLSQTNFNLTHTHKHRRKGVGVQTKEIPCMFEQYGTQCYYSLGLWVILTCVCVCGLSGDIALQSEMLAAVVTLHSYFTVLSRSGSSYIKIFLLS